MSSTNEEYVEGIYLNDGTLKKFKDADLTQKVAELNRKLNNTKYTKGDGYYIFPGGLQICWGYATVTYCNSNVLGTTITYPMPFAAYPYVNAFITNTDNSYADLSFNLKTNGQNTKGFDVFLHTTQGGFDASSRKSITWVAIGY